MNTVTPIINQQDLAHILHLLQLAESPDNKSQGEVYTALKEIQEHPISYLYLAILFANENISVNLRKLAGLTMSSALRRNRSILHFQQHQLDSIKTLVLEQNTIDLQNIKSMITSNLINIKNFDYSLFNYLLTNLQTRPQSISMVNVILQDLKFSSENYNIFEDEEFITCLEQIYIQIFSAVQKLRKQDLNNHPYMTQYLKCLNLITFHCPTKLYHYLNLYIQGLIKTILMQAQIIQIKNKLVVLALDGLNQILATKPALVNNQIMQIILKFAPIPHRTTQISKCWSNLIIQMIQNDDQGTFQNNLQLIIPKVIQNLVFTAKDEHNIKQDMQIQYNPYSQQRNQDTDKQIEDEDFTQTNYDCHQGYTLRKLSFQLLDKISIHYSQNLWSKWSQFVIHKLKSSQELEIETAISFIGAIAQTCLETMSNQIEQIVMYLIEKIQTSNQFLLKATSIWTLQKLLPAYQQNHNIIIRCLNLIYCAVCTNHIQKSTRVMMVQQASVSFLDEILQRQEARSLLDASVFQSIVQVIIYGLKIFKGRTLISIFKAISTIFEHNFPPTIFTQQIFTSLISSLNTKWSQNQKKDSVVCPLLQCLITACQSKNIYFRSFSLFYFQGIISLLKSKQRVALILRCIDFMSSIINNSQTTDLLLIVLSQSYLQQIYQLLQAQDKQIKHFTYGLISDIAKKYDISVYVQKFVQAIALTMESKNITSLCNALTSLTDLLTTYPIITVHYVPDVMQKVVDIISKERLQSIFALNFSRIYGRLSLLNPELSKQIILRDVRIIRTLFLSLRTREVLKITSDAFKGLVLTLGLLTQRQLLHIHQNLQCVIDALICYPLRANMNPQNEELLLLFKNFTKHIKIQIGQSNWNQLIQLPIFMPGSLRTLSEWLL